MGARSTFCANCTRQLLEFETSNIKLKSKRKVQRCNQDKKVICGAMNLDWVTKSGQGSAALVVTTHFPNAEQKWIVSSILCGFSVHFIVQMGIFKMKAPRLEDYCFWRELSSFQSLAVWVKNVLFLHLSMAVNKTLVVMVLMVSSSTCL